MAKMFHVKHFRPLFAGKPFAVISPGLLAVVGGFEPPTTFWPLEDIVQIVDEWEANQKAGIQTNPLPFWRYWRHFSSQYPSGDASGARARRDGILAACRGEVAEP